MTRKAFNLMKVISFDSLFPLINRCEYNRLVPQETTAYMTLHKKLLFVKFKFYARSLRLTCQCVIVLLIKSIGCKTFYHNFI